MGYLLRKNPKKDRQKVRYTILLYKELTSVKPPKLVY